MAVKELVKETIVVNRVSEFGVQVGSEWLGFNDPLTKDNFVVNGAYEVLTVRSRPTVKNPQGKKYINQIVGQGMAATVGALKFSPVAPLPVVPETTSTGRGQAVEKQMNAGEVQKDKEAYWDKKNMDMRLGGLMHDAAQVTSSLIMVSGLNAEDALKTYEEVLTKLIAIREKL